MTHCFPFPLTSFPFLSCFSHSYSSPFPLWKPLFHISKLSIVVLDFDWSFYFHFSIVSPFVFAPLALCHECCSLFSPLLSGAIASFCIVLTSLWFAVMYIRASPMPLKYRKLPGYILGKLSQPEHLRHTPTSRDIGHAIYPFQARRVRPDIAHPGTYPDDRRTMCIHSKARCAFTIPLQDVSELISDTSEIRRFGRIWSIPLSHFVYVPLLHS